MGFQGLPFICSSNHHIVEKPHTFVSVKMMFDTFFVFPQFEVFQHPLCPTVLLNKSIRLIFAHQTKIIMQEQNYKNHARMVTGFHYVLGAIILITLICSIINFYHEVQSGEEILESIILVLMTISVLLVAFYGRSFALKAQDRAIRAEENFRHYLLTGKPLDNSLKIGQILALRFAPDAELPELAQKAISENLGNKDIKQLIKDWKGDFYRV